MDAGRTRPATVRVLTALLAFQGISAVGGGAAFLADTSGGFVGMGTEILAATPFTTFLWPGLLLSLGLGVPAMVAAVGVHRRGNLAVAAALERGTGHHWSWMVSLAIGVALMAWIVVQLLLITERTFLQPLMFIVGAGLVVLPLLPTVRHDLAVSRS
ncbi:MAG: hypothetical protein ACNA8R_01795 [Nitriliruptoraceae bacterium]